jgi:uncharacterized protein YerC
MTQVSRRYLPQKVSSQIFDMFLTTITSLSTPASVNSFIEDLLSPTEQIVLGKRLAIAYMIQKGYTQRKIVDTLKVSIATVGKISLSMKKPNNGYSMVISHMLKIQKVSDFFDKIEEKLDGLMPPKGGNWSAHYARTSKERAKKKRAF